MYQMQDIHFWLGLGSLFRFLLFILANTIQTKFLSCNKVWCHLMQSYNCITCKIVTCDLSLGYYLGYDYLFWPISFKSSSSHARRFCFISRNNKYITSKIVNCDLSLDDYLSFDYYFVLYHSNQVFLLQKGQVSSHVSRHFSEIKAI